MPSFIVTVKSGATDADVQALKKKVTDSGGKITHEYTLIKGFAVEFPEGYVSVLDNHEHVERVEADGVVTTQ